MPKLSDLIGIINKIASPVLSESWDNSGLQLGELSAEVSNIMVALDPTAAVLESAINNSCQLLVTHHPLIFKPKKNISTSTNQGRLIYKAIQGNLAVFSLHTNYDIAEFGLNDLLASKVGLSSVSPLKITSKQQLAKLSVFIPHERFENVRNALLHFAEPLGNYRDCSFAVSGEGTFTPLDGASPFIGRNGVFEKVAEKRLELLIDQQNLPRAIKTLLSMHPYEEPAFDVYPLLNEARIWGLGRVGLLNEATTLAEYAARIKCILNAPSLRYVGDPALKIRKVAICSGSGASLLHDAARAGADVLVTGDVKYHDAQEAVELGVCLIDAGHFPSEIIMVEDIHLRLQRLLAEAGYSDCKIFGSDVEYDLFSI